MLYVFCGTNQVKARAKWRAVQAKFQEKNPQGTIFHYEAGRVDLVQLAELLTGHDLLGGKRLVTGDGLLTDVSASNFLLGHLTELVGSPNTFLLVEEKVPAATKQLIESAGGKVEEFATATPAPTSVFRLNYLNIFSLTKAVGERSRRLAWLRYQEAQLAGLTAEEIFWRLVWQIKTMLLVAQSSTRPLRTLKPFAVAAARRAAAHYSLDELRRLSANLVALWHDSKNEANVDFGLGLERWIFHL